MIVELALDVSVTPQVPIAKGLAQLSTQLAYASPRQVRAQEHDQVVTGLQGVPTHTPPPLEKFGRTCGGKSGVDDKKF